MKDAGPVVRSGDGRSFVNFALDARARVATLDLDEIGEPS